MQKQKKISDGDAKTCFDFIDKAEQMVRDAGQQGAFGMSQFEDLDRESHEVCPFLDNVGNAPPPDRDYFRNFFDENNINLEDKDAAANAFQKLSEDAIGKALQRVLTDPGVISNLLKAAGGKYQDAATSGLEAATSFYDDSAQRDLLARKTEILELTQKLEELQQKVQIAQDKLKEWFPQQKGRKKGWLSKLNCQTAKY